MEQWQFLDRSKHARDLDFDKMITVVSGLPRSGTSMMMQMLAAGGVPILADEGRQADEDNPQGYHEFAPAKRTKDDVSWLQQAPGKAVKVIYALLADLSPDYTYRINCSFSTGFIVE